jgi:cell division protein FtsZ
MFENTTGKNMTIKFGPPANGANGKQDPRILVVGVGGAGGNAVNNMIRSNLQSVDFVIANTDIQAMQQSLCGRAIQLGQSMTQGLGAGARPEVGRAAAEESLDDILKELVGANMVFITAGMGGGTGTGAAPVIARAARSAGILAVGVVTKPFDFEGAHRMHLADAGIEELAQSTDTLIVIPNQNLLRVADKQTTFTDAFEMADQVLYSGVRSVADLVLMPGLINLDFADIRAIMTDMGMAMWGDGEAEGRNRARAAAEEAISNPLLDEVSMKGARSVLINITGGMDVTLLEVDQAASRVRDEVDPQANIIFGSILDQNLEGRIRVSVVATGCQVTKGRNPRHAALGHAVGAFARKLVAVAKVAFPRKVANPKKAAPDKAAQTAADAPDLQPVPLPQAPVPDQHEPRIAAINAWSVQPVPEPHFSPLPDRNRVGTASDVPFLPWTPEPHLAPRVQRSSKDKALMEMLGCTSSAKSEQLR